MIRFKTNIYFTINIFIIKFLLVIINENMNLSESNFFIYYESKYII